MAERLPEKFNLAGRVAIITGGAGMLGRQYTRTLLEAGCRVAVADIAAQQPDMAAAAAAQEAGGDALGVTVDVRDKHQVEQMVQQTVGRWGRIDILVNNAGIDPKIDVDVVQKQAITFEDYPLELWQQSLDVNITGAFLCCQAVGKVMVGQRRGAIVNVSSTYGVVAPDQRLYQRDNEEQQSIFKPAAYAVSKAGMIQLTRYLAAYWGPKHIRVNTLTPHGIYSAQDEQFLKRYAARSPLGRMADKDEMNGALLFLVSDASSYMTGANLVVDGGWTAW